MTYPEWQLRPVYAYRYGLYLLTAQDQETYATGYGPWTVAYLDPDTWTLGYVNVSMSLADARRDADAHHCEMLRKIGA